MIWTTKFLSKRGFLLNGPLMNDPITFNFNVDTSRMLRALDTDDDIGAVIRIHFEIDRALAHVIDVVFPDPGQLRLRYTEQRVRALLALGLPKARMEPVLRINRIRNLFAHNEGKEALTISDINEIETAVEAMFGKKIPSHFALINKKTGSERTMIHSEMTLKQKFCLSGFFVVTNVAMIENEYQMSKLEKIASDFLGFSMSTLFPFLHRLFAFTLVGALAVEFILIGPVTSGQGVTVPVAKRAYGLSH